MARALRSKDRSVNRYPHLHYPEIYVLKDGYKNFYNTEGTKVGLHAFYSMKCEKTYWPHSR